MNQFSNDLKKIPCSQVQHNCTHHRIPRHLAYFIDELKPPGFDLVFYMNWFGISLTEQVLHKYFPDAFALYIIKFGEHPIPMRGAGMGCIAWDNPIWLIETFVPLNTSKEKEAFKFYLNTLMDSLQDQLHSVGVTLIDFLLAIRQHKTFEIRHSEAALIFKNVIFEHLLEF